MISKQKKSRFEQQLFNKQKGSKSILMKLRSRIHKILDEQFVYWTQKINNDKEFDSVTINESILEDWVQMFKNEVLIGKNIKHQQKSNAYQQNIKTTHNLNAKNTNKISFPKPYINHKKSSNNNKIIHKKDQNTIDVFQYSQKCKWKSTSYQIPQQRLKPFCSINYSSYSNSIILIGGHKSSNPNIKSSKISQLSLNSSSFTLLCNLPYGLSSHSTVSNQQNIYIIGGNKNHCITSKGCFRYNERQNRLQQISCLNYPVANANCILFKQKWIYKFGGIGQAFGKWDNSPYIERYSINDDYWQVINPITDNLMMPEIMFLANSNSYICEQQNKIFVFGGHDINGKFKQHGFVLKIDQNSNQQGIIEHKILQYGIVQCEQIIGNSFVFTRNGQNQIRMYAIKNYLKYQHTEKQTVLFHTFL